MNIVRTRRIAQVFFLAVFVAACLAAAPDGAGRYSNTPPNAFLYADPLAALAAWAAAGTLPTAFVAALGMLAMTLVFGRFFCGWICPLGTLQQAAGWLARRRAPAKTRIVSNRHRPAQRAKYYGLAALTAGALGAAALRAVGGLGLPSASTALGSLPSGWLDPLCVLHRAFHLAAAPFLGAPRQFMQAAWMGGFVLAILALGLWFPRAYCRYICPLGALYGLFARWSLLRMGKTRTECSNCERCQRDCEGACEPATRLRPSECVLCFNCLHVCPDEVIGYRGAFPPATENAAVDTTRRGVLVSLASGALALPLLRLHGLLGRNFSPRLLRPPGALAEAEFLARCLKCGQCMGACPSNIIQPAGLEAGIEGLWTPLLNFRIGTAGCLPECTACGEICPTGAIRRLSADERLARGAFADREPVRIGLAFVDRGRCLPWAMDRPCIVCQEVCPVSPKAIGVVERFAPVGFGPFRATGGSARAIEMDGALPPEVRAELASGDVYVRWANGRPLRAAGGAGHQLSLADPAERPPEAGEVVDFLVRLQQPMVDPRRCIGCGLCEHHCPVAGLKAIRVTAENESRHPEHRLTPPLRRGDAHE